MKTYKMRIRDKFIELIRNGTKKREYRLNDDARRSIKSGDTIVLVSTTDETNYIRVKVGAVFAYKSWREALEENWREDFARLYSSLDEALKDCSRFYTREEVEKSGIAVFEIEEDKVDFSQVCVLLDTNIIINRESHNNVLTEVAEMYKWLDALQCRKMIHPETKKELSNYGDIAIRKNLLAKLGSYVDLIPDDTRDALFSDKIGAYPQNPSSEIDNDLLLQAYNGVADLLITNDKEILRKADSVYIRDRVMNVAEYMRSVERLFPKQVEYKMLRVRHVPFASVSLDDPFFDSLKEDYGPGFTSWFMRKRRENESAYVYFNDGKPQGFLYLKLEGEKEPYGNIAPKFEPKRRLKVGTFKIDRSGFRLGERFLKIIFGNAAKERVDEIYVTLFEGNRPEVTALRDLLMKWGFVFFGKKNGDESVFVKDMKTYDYDKDPKFNFPLLKPDARHFFLPIDAKYHTDLFPDSILTTEDFELYNSTCAHRYALEKAYVSGKTGISAVPGDVLVIYRSGERWPKRYTSVVTGLAVLEKISYPKTIDEFMGECKNVTVFSDEELKTFYNGKKYRTVIRLLDLKTFDKKVILDDLYSIGAVDQNSGPRPFDPIPDGAFRDIIKLAEKGETE